MIMNRLNSELRGHAVSYGLCTQWQGDWQNNKSQQELIGMYIRCLLYTSDAADEL